MSQTKAQLIDTLVASLLPASDSAIDIGSNAVRFANIYGDNLYGSGANLTALNIVSDTSPQLGGDLQTNGNNISFSDDDELRFGAGNDFVLEHNGTRNIIKTMNGDINIRYSGQDMIVAKPSGAVELYYDNSKKFQTTSTGVDILGSDTTGSNLNGDLVINNAAGTRYAVFDASHTKLNFSDNALITLGNSNDLEIYHSSSNAAGYIQNSTGNLFIEAPASAAVKLRKKGTTETMIVASSDGAVELYYDNSKKLETTSSGAFITKELEIEGTAVNDFESGRIRLTENAHGFLGGYVHYDGNANVFYIGVHPTNDSTVGNDVNAIKINRESSNLNVELNHGGSKKFETTSTGANLYGHFLPDTADTHDLGSNAKKWSELHLKHYLYMPDAGRIRLGSSYDMQLFYDGSDQVLLGKTGTTYITCPSSQSVRLNKSSADNFNAESMLRAFADGAVELYYDNSKKLETTSTGIYVNGDIDGIPDGSKILVGTHDDIQIFHQTNASYIKASNHTIHLDSGTTSAIKIISGGSTTYGTMANFNTDGAVELYFDGTKKFATYSNGVLSQGTGEVNLLLGSTNAGGAKLILDGDSNGDASGSDYSYIYHDTSGDLQIVANNPSGNADIKFFVGAANLKARFDESGNLRPENDNDVDLGNSNKRWKNIYTNDLNLSNEGGANDVDGTWGSYTIQEGEESLFLINKRNGKKYKFALTEVS